MNEDFIKQLQQNSISAEEIKKSELEERKNYLQKKEAQEKQKKAQFRIDADKLYCEFCLLLKNLCIEAVKNGLFISRNGKNEIHGFIAQCDTSYYSDEMREDFSSLSCYIYEFYKYNLFGKPQFKYDFDQSLHKSIGISDKHFILKYESKHDKNRLNNFLIPVYNVEEENYFLNYIKNNVENIVFTTQFKKCFPHKYYENRSTPMCNDIHHKLRSIDFIITY